MSDDNLPRTPEGDLIRRVRDRAVPKLSIPAAAARIGLSAEHWGNVERGHKSGGKGKPALRVVAPAPVLAKMAAAVDVTPDQLESAAREHTDDDDRRRVEEAASELREMQGPVPSVPAGEQDDDGVATVFSLLTDPFERKLAELLRSNGFPQDAITAEILHFREVRAQHEPGNRETGRHGR